MGFQTNSEENPELRAHSEALPPFNFAPSHEQSLYAAQIIAEGHEEGFLQASGEADPAVETLGLFSLPSELSQCEPVVSSAASPWKPQLMYVSLII